MSRQDESAAALAEITTLLGLTSGWDGPESRAPDPAAVAGAEALVAAALQKARARKLVWNEPVVVPQPDGGIEVLWVTPLRTALLFRFRPGERDVCTLSPLRQGASMRSRTLALVEAAREVILTLEGSTFVPLRAFEKQAHSMKITLVDLRRGPLPEPPQDDLTSPPEGYFSRGEANVGYRIPDATVEWMREMFAAGLMSYPALAVAVGCDDRHARDIVYGRKRKHGPGPITRPGQERWVERKLRLEAEAKLAAERHQRWEKGAKRRENARRWRQAHPEQQRANELASKRRKYARDRAAREAMA